MYNLQRGTISAALNAHIPFCKFYVIISTLNHAKYFQGFYCGTETDFDDLCSSFSQFITNRRSSAMFELHKERPEHWPPYEPYIGSVNVRTSGTVSFDSISFANYLSFCSLNYDILYARVLDSNSIPSEKCSIYSNLALSSVY